MTRKDYIKLADAIREARERISAIATSREALGAADYALDIVTNEICRALKSDNVRFDRERFVIAAGLTRGVDTRLSMKVGAE